MQKKSHEAAQKDLNEQQTLFEQKDKDLKASLEDLKSMGTGEEIEQMVRDEQNALAKADVDEKAAAAASKPQEQLKVEAKPVVKLDEKLEADRKKKETQKPKFEKIRIKVDTKKQTAAAKCKEGNYNEAVTLYKSAVEILDDSLESFPLFKKEISQLEAVVFNNIAFCYGKDQLDKKQVEFCTKVIDRAPYLVDINVLIKAYLRRGLAYESLDKFKLAVNDLHRVRELQPQNKQAQTAMNRCRKYIKQDEGIDYMPENQDAELLDLPEMKAQDPVVPTKAPAAAPATTPAEGPKESAEIEKDQDEPTYQPEKELDVDFVKLSEKLTGWKEKGNLHFKKKSYKEAIKHFSEGVKIFEEAGKPVEHSEASDAFKLLVSQIYTNRSLAFHNLNQQASALGDAVFVLEHIDAKNPKALFRRAHALKTQGKFQEAARDFQVLMKEAGNASIKKELDECMAKMIEEKKRKTEEEKNKPKITELTEDSKKFKKVQIQEDSEDSDDDEALQKKKQAAKGKTATIDKETLARAQDKAAEQEKAQVLQQYPKTAAGFEKNFNAIKKDQAALFTYLKNIPLTQIEAYFKKTEVQVEILSGILATVAKHAFESKTDAEWAGSFLLSLGKASQFDMTIMFAEDSDKKAIKEIVDKLATASSEHSKQVSKVYTCE